ncbi:MAG TPA: hypothetical protein VHT51_05375 [Micropepsaceae bacterium]|jgi:hypothetical protein|nr:hypothetical protein [Micropepsaceae bacterium]
MHDPRYLLLLDVLVAVLVALDLTWTLKTGRARGRISAITRKAQPARYWRYVYSSYALLGFLAVLFVWAWFWPDSLR